MAGEFKIAVNDRPMLVRAFWRVYGAATVLDELPGPDSAGGSLPGIGMARAIAERVVAEEKTQLSQETFKAIAKAGHDVSAFKSVRSDLSKSGELSMIVEFYDLADLAEGRP